MFLVFTIVGWKITTTFVCTTFEKGTGQFVAGLKIIGYKMAATSFRMAFDRTILFVGLKIRGWTKHLLLVDN